MKVSVKGGDKLEHLIQTYKKLKIEAVAGVFQSATNSETGERVAPYAAMIEYGTIHTPARPFLRQTVEKHSKEWKDYLKRGLKVANDENAERVMGLIGRRMRSDIVRTIRDGDFEPLDAKTVRAKSRKKRAEPTTPLIDTTSLIKSIASQVRRKI